ncbi:MAG: outer membrane beta-barrel protein [Polyangia bacterium]
MGQSGGVEYLSHGGGFSIWGGVEIGRIVGIEAKYAASFHNPASDCGGGPYVWCDVSYLVVQTLSLDLKLHIPTNTRVVPYAVVGPMVGWIGRQGYLADAIGGGFEAGGGIDVWFSRHGTFGAEVLYRGLRMGDYGTYTNSNTYLSFVQVGITLAAHFP